MKASKYSLWLFILGILATSTLYTRAGSAQKPGAAFHPVIPRTWDDAPMAELEVPLADPIGSPKHVSADYYYKIPVRADLQELPSVCARSRATGIHRLAEAAGAGDRLGR